MADRRPYVVGIDPSLTATGVATAGVFTLAARHGRVGITTLPLHLRVEAIDQLVGATLDMAMDPWESLGVEDKLGITAPTMLDERWRVPDLVVIEAPDTSARYGGLVERIAYHHLLIRAFVLAGIPIASHPSAILKGYATGKGGTGKLGKAPVIAAVAEYWPEYATTNDNECDAAVLAQMGLEWLTGESRVPVGHSDWLLRKKNGKATVVWPETHWEAAR